ncbi:heme-binding protein [Telmatospirillum sp.]|uniref:GlcG/HbpS family heme-binding protein n=1 Tax=Telmatospirillum sp. TaxID=2079197 RepID=UPI002840289B|nr:heme-binding protein [Telmatospirillum sp.]MDR3438600.1 heme-binding protein [Telmatospirillum sp.]
MKICTGLPSAVGEALAKTCKIKAMAIGVPMAVALVDAVGGLQIFSRMDGTLPASTELSVSKAYTAAVFRMPTHDLGRQAQPGAALYGVERSHNGRIVLFGGGFPFCLRGVVVGAVGVSGGSVDQDMQVAQQAVLLLGQMEAWMEKIVGLVCADSLDPREASQVTDDLQRKILSRMDSSAAAAAIPAVIGGLALAFACGAAQ